MKKLLQQLKDNFSELPTQKEKRLFQRMISGKLVTKYRVLEKEKKLKPVKKRKQKLTFTEQKRKERKKSIILKKKIENFMEEDSNSRVCAGKKDVITKQGVRKQKRVMLDTLINLHKLFIEKSNIKISYALFCKFRSFWVVQSRYDKCDTCLCVTHYNIDLILSSLHQAKIISVSNYVGLLNTICCDRYDEKCIYPRDLILDLQSKTKILLRHELNIVHQYMAIKSKKETLTKQEAIIHVDFSENYQTKYTQEVQSFHFGGSREQISIHTVVVYTKENNGELKCSCYCTLSKNLKAFLSTMKVHQVTASIFLPNHLPMKSLSCFCNPEACNHFVLGTMEFATKNTRPRLNVDNVYGSESDDEPLINCRLSKQLPTSSLPYATVSENASQLEDEPSTSGSNNKFNNGDFVLVRILHKDTEYRYVAMCTGIEEDNEEQVIFCKICDNTGKNFRIDDNDVSFISWGQIIEKIPTSNLKMKGQRIYYEFHQSINVFEKP